MAASEREHREQLRALYATLIVHRDRFAEFTQLLDRYGAGEAGEESAQARAVRTAINNRVRAWLGGDFRGFTVTDVVLWRGVILGAKSAPPMDFGVPYERPPPGTDPKLPRRRAWSVGKRSLPIVRRLAALRPRAH